MNSNQTAEFDLELIKRYDGRGPRYTSYPTAVQFHDGFTAEDYERLALASNGDQPESQPLSIYVHVPFCHSLCYYCGCHKIVSRHQHSADPYVEHLVEEMRLQGRLFDPRRRVDQLHFGGGTPTFLDEAQFAKVMDGLFRYFGLHHGEQREYSIEIDPRSVDDKAIPRLAEMGFNRLSLGIQDFDPAVQQAVNRLQDEEWTLSLIRQARESGFRSVSVDLIYGLPKQTAASFTHTLESVVRAKPDRIAAYSYAHLPEMFRSQRLINQEDLPTAAEKLALLTRTVEFLTGHGYEYIGMDHFALPEDDLVRARHNGSLHRNFQGYSTHAELDLVGLGVSAIGKVGNSYAQSIKLRQAYYEAIEAGRLPVLRGIAFSFPPPADEERHAALLGLRPQFGAARSLIRLDNAGLRQPLPQANAIARRAAEDQCRQLLERRRTRSGLALRIRERLLRETAAMPDMPAVAAELCMTPRTLRRRLAGEGTTFSAIRDEVRRALAEELLSMTDLSIAEIAGRLGYADPTCFTNAFKGWKNGMTPLAWRRWVEAAPSMAAT